jgi:hypothetical protein
LSEQFGENFRQTPALHIAFKQQIIHRSAVLKNLTDYSGISPLERKNPCRYLVLKQRAKQGFIFIRERMIYRAGGGAKNHPSVYFRDTEKLRSLWSGLQQNNNGVY